MLFYNMLYPLISDIEIAVAVLHSAINVERKSNFATSLIARSAVGTLSSSF